ncbi:MAG: VOC family protein [Novosphingobium sp.]|nr:VOC family protein [Novosphingobium sp.]
MSVELNHTIVWCSDQKQSAAFFSEMLGLHPPRRFAHFDIVDMANGVSLDFADKQGPVARQHYAFLVEEDEFDAIMARIAERGLTYWADPARQKEAEINRHDGGRGVYFEAPDGHLLEAITRPYGNESRA